MIAIPDVPERFRRVLGEIAPRFQLRGADPAAELAERFGLRRFVERTGTGDPEHQKGAWLDRGAQLLKETRQLSRTLDEARIKHFFFKGIGLLGRFYRAEERRLADLDLMIRPADRNNLMALLHARGYGEMGDAAAWAPGKGRPGVTVTADGGADEDGGRLLIDLHWGLEAASPVLPVAALQIPDSVWRALETTRGFPVPKDEYHAALILHHLVRHDLLHVRGLLDFALLWNGLPRMGGAEMTGLARHLGVGRALRVVGRVLVNDLMLFPLRGVRLAPVDWRDRLALRSLRLRRWLLWAARSQSDRPRHVIVTRRRVWRRFLLTDVPHTARLLRELFTPRPEYLRWQWPKVRSQAEAWRRHMAFAIRS